MTTRSVVYVNGINTSAEDAKTDAALLSARMGGVEVTPIYDAAQNFAFDAHVALIKLVSEEYRTRTDLWGSAESALLERIESLKDGDLLLIVAHSRGTILARNVIHFIYRFGSDSAVKALKRLDLIALGTPLSPADLLGTKSMIRGLWAINDPRDAVAAYLGGHPRAEFLSIGAEWHRFKKYILENPQFENALRTLGFNPVKLNPRDYYPPSLHTTIWQNWQPNLHF